MTMIMYHPEPPRWVSRWVTIGPVSPAFFYWIHWIHRKYKEEGKREKKGGEKIQHRESFGGLSARPVDPPGKEGIEARLKVSHRLCFPVGSRWVHGGPRWALGTVKNAPCNGRNTEISEDMSTLSLDYATVVTQLGRLARRMDALDVHSADDRREFLSLCRERQALQRERWALLAPGAQDAAQGHQRPATSALDAPAWPDAPTEEITHPLETTHA